MEDWWCVSDCASRRGGGGDVRVDSTDHTSLAVLTLRAIEPDWLRILDMNGVSQDAFLRAVRGVGGHEAGEKGIGFIGHDVLDWNAGLVEGGLDD